MASTSGFRAGAGNGAWPLVARGPHRRAATSPGDGGYTLVELLIVIVTLGILAAVVVFGLRGVTAQTEQAACATDAKTVVVALGAYHQEHPGVLQVTEAQLVASGTGALQTWPLGPENSFSIEIAGDANTLVGQLDSSGNIISDNDVIVLVGSGLFDASVNFAEACSTV